MRVRSVSCRQDRENKFKSLQRPTTLKFITENFLKFKQSDKHWGYAEENGKKENQVDLRWHAVSMDQWRESHLFSAEQEQIVWASKSIWSA